MPYKRYVYSSSGLTILFLLLITNSYNEAFGGSRIDGTASLTQNTSYNLFAFGHPLEAPSKGFTISVTQNDTLGVFSIGIDNFVYYRDLFRNGTSVNDWKSLGGQVKSITSGIGKKGNLVLYSIGLDDIPYYKQQFNNGTWSPDWTSLGGQSKQIASTNDKNGNILLFSIGKGTNQTYYKQQFSNGTWSPDWTSLGGQSKFINPRTASIHDLILLSIGLDDIPYYKQQFNNGTWSPNWTSLEGQSKYITSVNDGNGNAIFFSVSRDDAVYYRHLWEEWKPLLSVGKSGEISVSNGKANKIYMFTKSLGYDQLFYYELEDQPIPILKGDTNLRIELIASGLASPTSMAFIDNNTILILEKETGNVRRISNGLLQDEPLLRFATNSLGERGLLGIGIQDRNVNSDQKYVYLYVTEEVSDKANQSSRNRLYRFNWESNQFTGEGKLLLDLPSDFRNHNGGKIVVTNDSKVFTVIGDQNERGILQNNASGHLANDTAVIFKIDENGSDPLGNPFSYLRGDFTKYYAYGIRNSFGLTNDPLNGNLWDTENGDLEYDEVNLVLPGFNSGWSKVMGPIARSNTTLDSLVNLKGSHYSDPVFSWKYPIGVTDIEFLDSSKLGPDYDNSLLIGDIHKGNLYHFTLSENRSSFQFNHGQSLLNDRVADNEGESDSIIFGSRFGGITDIATSPDGYPYVLTYTGHLYKIAPDRSIEEK